MGVPVFVDPCRSDKLAARRLSRERRATVEELSKLAAACGHTRTPWVRTMIQMAIETGMRRSELLSITWANVDLVSRTVHLPITKNGHPRTIPLSSVALETLRHVPRTSDTVFPVTGNAVRLAWERLKRRAGVTGLRFHDLRHEAVSRFFEKGLTVPEFASISGHRDPRMLMRYTHPRAAAIAEKLQ